MDKDWWNSFCCQQDKSEDEMKSLLFKGELNEKEYKNLINCARFSDWMMYRDEDEGKRSFMYFILYGKLFKSCPQLIDRCNWDMLDIADWEHLLTMQPQE